MSVKTARKNEPSRAEGKTAGKLEIIFAGPLLFVPTITSEKDGQMISDVEIFSPLNGHPVGAVFLPEVWFEAEDLDNPGCEHWPSPASFSMLDPHSYSIDLVQNVAPKTKPIHAGAIPATNHKIKPGRRLSHEWEIAIAVRGQLSGWSSHRHSRVTDDLYVGADAPRGGMTAALHKLTYEGVTGAEFHGAGLNPRTYLREEAKRGGSLIVVGEIPYQPTLQHERRAIDALARLAGLDLHLADTSPQPHKSRLMDHMIDCGHSIVIAPEDI
jgi:hypothetical protein